MTSLGNAPSVVRDPVPHRVIQRGRMINVGQVAVLGLGVALLSAQGQETTSSVTAPVPPVAVQLPTGQVPPGDQTPTFRARTDIIQLDVSVLDRQGQPVRGLAAGDFTVLKDGRPQPVVAFAAIDVPTWNSGVATWMREIGADVASNRVDAQRAVVIVIDDVQATPAADPLIPLAKTIANAAIDGLGPTESRRSGLRPQSRSRAGVHARPRTAASRRRSVRAS